jgi:molecular chaperone GrpE
MKKKTTKTLEKENQQLLESLKLAKADFENYKKRQEKQEKESIEYASAELTKNLLPILDSFEQAMKNTKDLEQFKKGMQQIQKQILQTLEKEGLQKIESSEEFNPYIHEALLTEESEQEQDTILEELQTGYQFKNKIIRHTKVKISRGKK